MGKQRAIEVYLDSTFVEKEFSTDNNVIRPEKNEEVRFTPSCVIHERRSWSRFKFYRHPRDLVFFVKGTVEAIKFSENLKEMNPFWTMKEATDFVHKQILKSLSEHKPMTWTQFILILIPILIIMVLAIRVNMALVI